MDSRLRGNDGTAEHQQLQDQIATKQSDTN